MEIKSKTVGKLLLIPGRNPRDREKIVFQVFIDHIPVVHFNVADTNKVPRGKPSRLGSTFALRKRGIKPELRNKNKRLSRVAQFNLRNK